MPCGCGCSSVCEYIVNKCRGTGYSELRDSTYKNPYNAITPENAIEWKKCPKCECRGIRHGLPCIWCDISAEHVYGREYHPNAHSIMLNVPNSECVRKYRDTHRQTHPNISDIDAFRILLHTHNTL